MSNSYYSPEKFSILPPVVKNLLIINILMFLATVVFEKTFSIDLNNLLGLHYVHAQDFQPYQFITYMFMHGSVSHIFFNMFALWMFGSTIENYWGGTKFLIYYLITGIGAGLTQEIVWFFDLRELMASANEILNMGGMLITKADYINRFVTVGASGSVYGLLLAFGMLFPNAMIYLYFFIPMKAKWFVIIFGLVELLSGIFSSGDGIAHFAHLGGMIFGLILILLWRRRADGNYQQ